MAGATLTGEFELTPEQASPILSRSRKTSWFMQYANRIPLGLDGTNVPVWDHDLEGGFVDEAGRKPVDDDVVNNKKMLRRKWSLIVAMSKETARASATGERGMAGYATTVRDRIAASWARSVDRLAATGSGLAGQSYMNQTTKSVALGTATQANGGTWADFNTALQLLVEDTTRDRSLDAWVFDNVVEPITNASVDLNGNPLYIDRPLVDTSPAFRPGSLMGRPSGMVRRLRNGVGAAQVVGYAGDYSNAYFGLLSPLSFSVSDIASYTNKQGESISAFQNNLVLILAEAELGVLIGDPEDFVKITSSVGAPVS